MNAPKVSVVIAAYSPGAAFDRVMASLDAQTLPQDEFETIVVDDGSPDDTVRMLSDHATARPNMRVERIENSGWPSRPRNVGTGLARGEYVLYMDHDDSLYPDALRRLVEYAAETGTDVVSPKESKTTDAWWNMPTLARGNVPDITVDGGIAELLPMVPHKLYRRAFLEEHGIAFPEGRRQLWEDIYLNVAAWRHAERVAVLADTPVYLWHSSGGNNSKSYGPTSSEYWDRLEQLLAFMDATFDGEERAEARRTALLHQYQGRVLGRLSRALQDATDEEAAAAVARARSAQQRWFPEEWDALLAPEDRARAVLLRLDRRDLLGVLATTDADLGPVVTATAAEWRSGRLHLDATVSWRTRDGAEVVFRKDGGRVLRDLPEELLAVLPADVVDVTDTLGRFRLGLGVRDREAAVTWALPGEQEVRWLDLGRERVTPVLHATAVLDIASAAAGAPLGDRVHDIVAGVEWNRADYWPRTVRFDGAAAPAVVDGRPGVAYRSTKGALALDLSSDLRNVLADGGTPAGPIPGTPSALTVPMPRVRVQGSVRIPAAARLTPEGGGAPLELPGVLIAEAGAARLEVGAGSKVPSGPYELSYRVGAHPFFGKRLVDVAGKTITIRPKGGAAPPAPAKRGLGALLRRG